MLPPEIVRTRRWIYAAAALFLASVPVLVWLGMADRGWTGPVIGGAVIALLLVLVIVDWLISRTANTREAGYRLAYDRFVVFPPHPLGLAVFAQVSLMVMYGAMNARSFREPILQQVLIAAGAIILVVACLRVRSAWRGTVTELSPQGIESRTAIGRRLIPWEALALGGPIRPSLLDYRLGLIVSKPELVVKSGWAFWHGTRERPFLLLNTKIHPWFLADSIAWYVANPAERTAIGTQAGHARLQAELSVDVPVVPIEPSS